MSQVDNRNSFAGKRARTDGGRREDDWTCPNCGNVNFSFRTTCNMRNCTQSRPMDHNVKSTPKSMHGPPPFTSAAGYLGSAVPSSVYGGGAPYGSSYFNGSPLPPYDLPPAGGSGYPYGYGGRLSVGSPYGPLHMSGPPPYSGGSMLGAGGMYGMPPLMDRYGMGLHMGHGAMGPSRPGAYPEEDFQKKPAGRDNDWICPNCGNRNFAFRDICNMRKCNTPRPGNQGTKPENSKGSKPKMPEGSWKCEKCNNINYPFRTKCNRQNCGAERPSEANEARELTSDEDEQEKELGRRPTLAELHTRTHQWQNDASRVDLPSAKTQEEYMIRYTQASGEGSTQHSETNLWTQLTGGVKKLYGVGSHSGVLHSPQSYSSIRMPSSIDDHIEKMVSTRLSAIKKDHVARIAAIMAELHRAKDMLYATAQFYPPPPPAPLLQDEPAGDDVGREGSDVD